MLPSEISTTTSTNRPHRYKIREKLLTFGNNFKIKDEFGHDKYTVRSKKWTLQKKLVLEDMNGK